MVKEAYAQLKDGRMFYRHDGKGEPVILLHPAGTSSWAWHMMQPLLAKKFSVYALDMLGAGDSDKPKQESYSLEAHAHNIVAFMDAMKLDTAMLVGNSVGAMLSLHEAGSHPDRVTRMVLIGMPGWTAQEGGQLAAQFRDVAWDKKGLPKPMTLEQQRMTEPNITPELADAMNKVRAKSGVWSLKTMEALSKYDVPSHLGKVRCPTLVVYGDRDPIAEKKDLVAKGIPGARLHMLSNAGHIPQLEHPEEVARVIADFLSQPAAAKAKAAAGR